MISTHHLTIFLASLSLCLWPPAEATAAGPVFASLYSFLGGTNPASPQGPLVVETNGVIYGTTGSGGTYGGGTVFSLSPPTTSGGAWTEALLWSFGGSGDGFQPYTSGLLIGPKGVLYGATLFGGRYAFGTIFSLAPPAAAGGAWTERLLHSFGAGTDGRNPEGPLALGPGGVLFGVTDGGYMSTQYGTVFSLVPSATRGGAWTESILYSFTGGDDGGLPQSGVVLGGGGVLYGLTSQGGGAFPAASTIFSLAPPASPGGVWTETVLYTFPGSPLPLALIAGSGGVLYGTTNGGGAIGAGTVFSLAPPASPGGAWTETGIYTFSGANGTGEGPLALALDKKTGALYGTTGATDISQGDGIVFELRPPKVSGRPWGFGVLHTFDGSDGTNPEWCLVRARNGVLYGTTNEGGAQNFGTVYSLEP